MSVSFASDPAGSRTPEQAADFDMFARLVRRRSGVDLGQYRLGQTYRRVWAIAEREGCQSLMEFYCKLTADATAMDRFLDRLAINYTELFRNPEQFEVVRESVLPDLLRRSPALRIWSAGCSNGAEAYSFASLLDMAAPGRAHQVVGTDIDQAALSQAREGVFTRYEMRHVQGDVQRRYFHGRTSGERETYEVGTRLRELTEFSQHNLLADGFETGWDLIACRNVVIYFAEEATDELYRRLFDALKPGGYLFVGGTERVRDAAGLGFAQPRPYFYQKPDIASGGK